MLPFWQARMPLMSTSLGSISWPSLGRRVRCYAERETWNASHSFALAVAQLLPSCALPHSYANPSTHEGSRVERRNAATSLAFSQQARREEQDEGAALGAAIRAGELAQNAGSNDGVILQAIEIAGGCLVGPSRWKASRFFALRRSGVMIRLERNAAAKAKTTPPVYCPIRTPGAP